MRKVLCPVDGSKHAERAIVFAVELADAFGASLTICAVNVLIGAAGGPAYRLWTDDEARKLLDESVAIAARHGQTVPDTVILAGREASASIVHHAESDGFDCIVLGTGDKRGLSRLMLGSVAADVSHRAHCTVVTVR